MITVCSQKRHRKTVVHNSLESYLHQIEGVDLLTADEEKMLAGRIAEGDKESRDRLILANLRLVIKFARNYAGRGLPLQDLVEEGNLGLLRAVDGYDPNKGTRFSTYAIYWIKQAIVRALINTVKTIRIPVYLIELLSKWRRMEGDLTNTLGRKPTTDEMSQALQVPRRTMEMVKDAQRIIAMMRHSEDPNDGTCLEETLEDERTRTPDVEMVDSEEWGMIESLLEEMDPRDSDVLRMRFGLGEDPPKTLKEVGEALSLSRERVRQIEVAAIRRMSNTMTVRFDHGF